MSDMSLACPKAIEGLPCLKKGATRRNLWLRRSSDREDAFETRFFLFYTVRHRVKDSFHRDEPNYHTVALVRYEFGYGNTHGLDFTVQTVSAQDVPGLN